MKTHSPFFQSFRNKNKLEFPRTLMNNKEFEIQTTNISINEPGSHPNILDPMRGHKYCRFVQAWLENLHSKANQKQS